MLANENRLNSIVKLNEEMQQHQTLSVDDKRKLQQEMNKITTNWKTLEEKMETAVKRYAVKELIHMYFVWPKCFFKIRCHYRVTSKEGDLEKEREARLKEWQVKREAMEKWLEGREQKGQDFGKVDHNLDDVRKELTLVKVCVFTIKCIY